MKISQRIVWWWVLVGLAACECTTTPSVDPLAIMVEPTSLTLTAGGERGTLIARRIVSGEDVTAQVTWLSGDPGVASVESGVVSGRARGLSTITAELDGFSAAADVDVTVACGDGLKNGEESDVDCGGPFCAACAIGQTCNSGNDCRSTSCASGLCVALSSCFDGEHNGSESGTDCGGHGCAACGAGESCGGNVDCTSSVCTNGTCQAPTCTDGTRNGTETSIDCGGPQCPGCVSGEECNVASDCASGVCTRGRCREATCSDGVRNGTESGIDCGGSCAPCEEGTACNAASDCASGVCVDDVCVAPTCIDGVQNGTETSQDCGGPVCSACAPGGTCVSGADCLSNVCTGGVCQASSCADAVKNGLETALDCGGPSCPACTTGAPCNAGSDCQTGVCTEGLCQAAACNDGVQNGAESDLDCGGNCPTCANGEQCNAGPDCSSGVCVAGLCVAPACTDGVRNGQETDLDCGGPDCAPCAPWNACTLSSDCIFGVCLDGVCKPATCTDGVRNGLETGLDCGGTCPACGTGQGCSSSADCSSSVCVGGVCVAATCSDGVKNGTETATDCGGGSCPTCGAGQTCTQGSDCHSNVCAGGGCVAASCSDGVLNGTEAAIDCGGGSCPGCGTGQSCTQGSDCSSSVCTGGVCQQPTCIDRALNGTETSIDCGGDACPACGTGESCSVGSDCVSNVCGGGVCVAATCTDAVRNGAEAAIDCGGGTCPACSAGSGCTTAGDCAERVCTSGVCQAATCTDGVSNGNESDVDCGGSCAGCTTGGGCSSGADCASGVCSSNVCLAPTCTDGHQNGQETGLDCGGPSCAPCTTGQGCTQESDCSSGVCTSGTCQAATCTDSVKNGAETAVDCGGPACSACAPGEGCGGAGDCTSGVCTAATCQSPTCSDGVINGAETSIDCGGGTCPTCASGGGCTTSADCTSGVCSNNVCVAPACTDGVRNGLETAIDCGGPDCAPCTTGQGCTQGSDCGSNVCTTGVCQAATCTDGVTNGAETATDCGGGTCPACAQGLQCQSNADCTSGNCVNGTCAAAVVVAIEVTPATAVVPLGGTQSFVAIARLSDGSGQDVTSSATWQSSNSNAAPISSSGVLSALTFGTTEVQALYAGLGSNTASVTISLPGLVRIDVTPTGVQLPIGLVQAYEATGTLTDGSIVDLTSSVVWTSSAPSIASVGASGLVTALSAGNTNVVATAGGVSGQASLVVTSVFVTSISVTPVRSTLPAGLRAVFSATALLSDGSARDVSAQAAWASSSQGVATVSSTSAGLVTAVSAGTANITATLAGNTGTGVLTVINATLNSIQVFPADETAPRGFALHYGAVGLYSDGNAYDLTLSATWSSSSPAVATVSNTFPEQGLVTTLGAGTTQIRAALGGLTGATSLRVTNAQLTVLSVTPPLLTLPLGAPYQYAATGVFDDGTSRDVTELVRWSSSNLAVATISNAASTRGVAFTLGAGSSTITATLGTHTATSALTVTSATLEQLVISPPTPRIGRNGVVSFVATAVYTDGTGLDVTELAAWSSSNTTVATVRNDTGFRGVAVGVSAGTATITATFGSRSATARLTVSGASLDSMYISPAVVRTGIGLDVQFYVSGLWSDGTTGDLTRVATWTSSLTSVAVISNAAGSQGLATTRGQGVTTIRAVWAGVEDTTTLTVTNAALTSITVTPATAITGLGLEVQYRALARFSDGTTFDVTTNAAWTSSSPAVAAIDGINGLATALSGGVSTITARMGTISGSATLTVSSAPLVGLTVTPASAIIPYGFWRRYTATAVFDDGLRVDVTSQATWTTGTPTVAHAGNGDLYGGRVTGLSEGTSSVIARFGGRGGTATAIVMMLRLTNLEVTPQNATTSVGQPLQLTAIATFTDGTITIELDITEQVGWQVSPKKNGTVSNTDGSIAVVTMYNDSSSAIFHAIPPAISLDGAGDAHTKVSSP